MLYGTDSVPADKFNIGRLVMSKSNKSTESEQLQRAILHFKQHQDEFATKHHGEFVVIYEDKVEGFFDNSIDAYTAAKMRHPSGGFLLRECLNSDEEVPAIFRSRVA